MSSLDTRTDLVKELERIKNPSPLVRRIITEAKAGEYHDYKNKKYVCGKMAANELLTAAANETKTDLESRRILIDEAAKIRNGTYDEEADEEDKAAMREFCPPELRGPLGL